MIPTEEAFYEEYVRAAEVAGCSIQETWGDLTDWEKAAWRAVVAYAYNERAEVDADSNSID